MINEFNINLNGKNVRKLLLWAAIQDLNIPQEILDKAIDDFVLVDGFSDHEILFYNYIRDFNGRIIALSDKEKKIYKIIAKFAENEKKLPILYFVSDKKDSLSNLEKLTNTFSSSFKVFEYTPLLSKYQLDNFKNYDVVIAPIEALEQKDIRFHNWKLMVMEDVGLNGTEYHRRLLHSMSMQINSTIILADILKSVQSLRSSNHKAAYSEMNWHSNHFLHQLLTTYFLELNPILDILCPRPGDVHDYAKNRGIKISKIPTDIFLAYGINPNLILQD